MEKTAGSFALARLFGLIFSRVFEVVDLKILCYYNFTQTEFYLFTNVSIISNLIFGADIRQIPDDEKELKIDPERDFFFYRRYLCDKINVVKFSFRKISKCTKGERKYEEKVIRTESVRQIFI